MAAAAPPLGFLHAVGHQPNSMSSVGEDCFLMRARLCGASELPKIARENDSLAG